MKPKSSNRQIHLAAALLSWWFVYQHPIPDLKGAQVQAVAGPFERQSDCEGLREELEAYLATLFDNSKISAKCVERKPA